MDIYIRRHDHKPSASDAVRLTLLLECGCFVLGESKEWDGSVSATASEGITVREIWEGAGSIYPGKINTFTGKFTTEIFRDNEMVDYCKANFRAGFT